MRVRARGRKAAAVGAVAAGLIATVGAAPAYAGNAPSCVAVWVSQGTVTQTGYARNDCGSNVRIKISWNFGADGACWTVEPGYQISSKVARVPRVFNGADNC